MPVGRRRAVLAGAFAVLLVLLALRGVDRSTPSVAALGLPVCPGPEVGVQLHAIWSDYDDESRAAVLDRLLPLGVRTVRIDISWAALEPEQFRHSEDEAAKIDRVLDQVTARGVEPLVMLWLTPAWARSGGDLRSPPADPVAYGQIARWAAQRWPEVTAWQLWNEPNSEDFLRGADPATYAGLLQAGFDGVRDGNPDARVVFGGTAYQDADWIARAYDAGAGGHFDVMATHAYQSPSDLPPDAPADGSPYRLRDVERVHDLMARRGDGDLPIWFTEYGWSAYDSPQDGPAYARGVTEQEQADYLTRALDLLARRHPYVERAYWYNERGSGDPRLDSYGLLRRDLSAKPAARALAARTRDCA